ncbi:MAG TPA: pseudouridine synthase [Candidatus Angelobacter sp.]|nr:pseudouridine synthase [Candidatus Angelobacter sp.]
MARTKGIRRVGLARALSKLGYCSRSQASNLIRAGRVRLNGVTQSDPEAPVRVGSDRLDVDERTVVQGERIYLMMNKARGVVTTASDEMGRETVYAALGDELPWVAPVGRLDKASEGLLLLTNDSEWAARITAPANHIDKTYHIQIGALTDEALSESLVKGFRVANGEVLRVKSAETLRRGDRNTWLTVVLDEGKNRHIRRMLEAKGIEVLRLVRVAIGPLLLGDLPKGTYRALDKNEKTALDAALATKPRTQTR